MKRILIIVITLSIIGLDLFAAPKRKPSEAKKLFTEQSYALAIPAYEDELKTKKLSRGAKGQIETQIGICYFYLNKPKEAAAWLKRGLDNKYETAEVFALYGLALQKQEKYTEAKDAFQKCLKKDKRFPNINLFISSCDYAMEHSAANTQVKMKASMVNTDGSEYGISPALNEVFFSRAATKGKNIDPRTGLGFTEILSAKFNGDLEKPKKEKAFMKTFYNTGVFAFDKENNYMYMTMCDPKSGKCGIFRSKYNRSKWQKPEPVFVSPRYDLAHPAIANKGKRLYFTSNAPGGQGKTDIWYVDRVDDNEWSEAVNAGPTVNTAGREEFPFVENDSVLYFASSGHNGYGGLDIFAVAIDDGAFGDLINLGRPFNSGADDFNLIIIGDEGLLVSSRNVDNSDDIFIFDRKELPEPVHKTKKTEKPLVKPQPKPETKPQPKPETKPQPKPETQPQPKPETKPQPKPETKPQPKPETKPQPKPETKPQPKPQPEVKPQPEQATQPMTERDKEIISTIYFDLGKFIPQQQYRSKESYRKIVSFMRSYPNATFEIAGHTDVLGEGNNYDNKELSEKRADYVAQRLIDRGIPKEQIVVKGYGFSKPKVPNACTEKDYQRNRRVEIRILNVSK